MSIVGRTYFYKGEPVRILTQWVGSAPRNVLIKRADGSRVVRPFRGLRVQPSAEDGGKQSREKDLSES